METKVAEKIVKKWLRKGNITRCMRDILPCSGLNFDERERVAKLVHNVVRWKRWYEFVLSRYGMEINAENLVKIAAGEIKIDESVGNDLEGMKRIAIRHSFSDFLASFLVAHEDYVEKINREPETSLCVNFNRADREEIMNMLLMEGMDARKGSIPTSIIAEQKARYSEAVKKGYAHVQDESSQLIAMIATMHGDKILDYCAGNGGKTLAMASISKNGKEIHAHDIEPSRLRKLKERAALYKAKVKIGIEGEYDVVLVDAPCTGVGAARRNPEAKYVDGYGDYPSVQREILKEAEKYVKHGGYLIYSICSFLPEEMKAVATLKNFVEEKIDMKWLRRVENGYITWLLEGDILFVSVMKKK
ncbi:MAG: RsmB/NOP family class I SAM-dependent RNA methyltransferase [Thermoplasmata archaeon]|nr:RsmB/NOP family class I SAM-dependent RNA methyltransferase [Thermoplasmata archaeon]